MIYMIPNLQIAYSGVWGGRGEWDTSFKRRHNKVNIWIEQDLSNTRNKKQLDSLRSFSGGDESHKCVCELKRTDPFISVFLHLC